MLELIQKIPSDKLRWDLTYTAADGNRTRDLRTTNATHYRLCYNSLGNLATNDIIASDNP